MLVGLLLSLGFRGGVDGTVTKEILEEEDEGWSGTWRGFSCQAGEAN